MIKKNKILLVMISSLIILLVLLLVLFFLLVPKSGTKILHSCHFGHNTDIVKLSNDNLVIFDCVNNKIEHFDSKKNCCKTISDLDINIEHLEKINDNKILLWEHDGRAYLYLPETNELRPIEHVPAPRYRFDLDNEKTLFLNPQNIYTFDNKNNEIDVITDLNHINLIRDAIKLKNGEILILAYHNNCIFNPTTNTLKKVGNRHDKGFLTNTILLNDGKVLLFYPTDRFCEENDCLTELFDPETGQFEVSAKMPHPVKNSEEGYYLLKNGNILVWWRAYSQELDNYITIFYLYDYKNKVFKQIKSPIISNKDEKGYHFVKMDDGNLFFIGKSNCYIYDPALNMVVKTIKSSYNYNGFGILLGNGNVLIIRDTGKNCELYDIKKQKLVKAPVYKNHGTKDIFLSDGRRISYADWLYLESDYPPDGKTVTIYDPNFKKH